MKKWMLLVALVTCVLVFSSTQQAKAQCGCGVYYSGYAPGYPYYSTYYPSYAYLPVVSYGYGYPQYSYGYYPSYGYSYYRPSVSVFHGSGNRGWGYGYGGYWGYGGNWGYGYGGWGHRHCRW